MIDFTQFEGHSTAPFVLGIAEIYGEQFLAVSSQDGPKVGEKGPVVCLITSADSANESDMRNAALITASPELLAEVKTLRSQIAVAVEALTHIAVCKYCEGCSTCADQTRDKIKQIGGE